MTSRLDVFDAVVGAVGSAATVAAVVFAWKASRAAASASTQAEKALRVAQATSESSQAAAEAAERTVQTAQAAHEADEYDRKVHQLRDIGQIAEALFWKAAEDAEWQSQSGGWRVIEQNYLEQALVGVTDELPKCVELTRMHLPEQALGAAAAARIEVTQALRKLRAERHQAPPP